MHKTYDQFWNLNEYRLNKESYACNYKETTEISGSSIEERGHSEYSTHRTKNERESECQWFFVDGWQKQEHGGIVKG